jgi:hypothetical protein
MDLLNNLKENFLFLQNDFLGFSVNIWGIGQFLTHLVIALAIFVVFYTLGGKIRNKFFKENNQYRFFINIALGYIVLGTGLGLLGIFSLLHPYIVTGYLLAISIIAFYPFQLRKLKKDNIRKLVREILPRRSFLVIAVGLFVLIAFLRLITPEIAEDGYHTDNAKIFINSQTIMHASRDTIHTIPFPQLPEMIYMIPIFLGDKEAARFIHFGFYLLIIVLLFTITKDKRYHLAAFLPLFFVTTPVVIRNSPTQYTDFFAIFVFLLSIFLIGKNISKRSILLSGLLFGAVVSAKVWMLIYLPALLLYLIILNRKHTIQKLLITTAIFIGGYLLVSSLWYIRAYIISGNPIFPLLNKFFIKDIPVEVNPLPDIVSAQYFGLNLNMFTLENLAGLSPFFLVGLVSFFLVFHKKIKEALRAPLIILLVILTVEQLFIPVSWGRYLLMWFLVTSAFLSAGVLYWYKKSVLYRFGFITAFCLVFGYYFFNTLITLPYGFGWADKNAYLTRVLGRDNISYYDFNSDFEKWIKPHDFVAMYRIGNFYYADFHYVDIGYVLKGKYDSFDKLQEKGVTMLMIKGGNFEWFCKELALTDCDSKQVKRVATYPPDMQKYNLYLLQY